MWPWQHQRTVAPVKLSSAKSQLSKPQVTAEIITENMAGPWEFCPFLQPQHHSSFSFIFKTRRTLTTSGLRCLLLFFIPTNPMQRMNTNTERGILILTYTLSAMSIMMMTYPKESPGGWNTCNIY